MKNSLLLLIGLALRWAASAQSPAPEPDTLRDPGVIQGNPAPDNPPPVNYKSDEARVVPRELPAPVRHTLESDPQYKGWEKNPMYRSHSGNIYTIVFKEGNKSKAHRFDKTGKPLVEK